MSFAPDTKTFAKPETLFRVPIGLASPLWGLFAGAAITGATWWWMTRWTQVQNLEAMFGEAGEAQTVVEPALAASVAEAAETIVEANTPGAESTDAPIVESLIAAPGASEPVGGEAAPVSPVLALVKSATADIEAPANSASETAPAPRSKKKPLESRAADTSV